VQELGLDAIDINMGCPAKAWPAVVFGLMRTPIKVARLMRSLPEPARAVTCKCAWAGDRRTG
jgi:tRNA-dihydrouridine synthase